MRKVTIRRPKRFEGAIWRYGILLDDCLAGKISNGCTMTLDLDEREHRIALGNRRGSYRVDEVTIPAGTCDYCFQIDLIGVQTAIDTRPLLRPVPGTEATAERYEATVLRAGTMVAKKLLNSELLNELQRSETAYLYLVFDNLQWSIHLKTNADDRCIYKESYYRFNGRETKINPWKAFPIDHKWDKAYIWAIVLRDFVACLPDYRVNAGGRIVPASRALSSTSAAKKQPQIGTEPKQASRPVVGNSIGCISMESNQGIYGTLSCELKGNQLIIEMHFDWEDYGTGNRLGHASYQQCETMNLEWFGQDPKAVIRAIAVAAEKHWPYGFAADEIEKEIEKQVDKKLLRRVLSECANQKKKP